MKIFIAIIGLLFTSTVHAHKDRIVKIDLSGRLDGIPSEFGVYKVVFKFSKYPFLAIYRNNSAKEIPSCITKTIRSKSQTDVAARASWYHDPNVLPPYLVLWFFDSSIHEEQIPRTELLFNLKTLEIIRITRITRLINHELNPADLCKN